MNKISITSIIIMMILVSCKQKVRENDVSIIPKPVSLIQQKGEFRFGETVHIVFDESSHELAQIADYLKQQIEDTTNIICSESGKPIELKISQNLNIKNAEGYELEVTKDKISIQAVEANGVFYGIQTLFQLMPAEFFSKTSKNINWTIPCVKITDFPQFQYRGMHLDVCRHFFPVSFVKKYLDYMALHKLNTLHFHLTEDQGWRIEIIKYPGLTDFGSVRKETIIGKTQEYDGKKYGGFYTQDDIKEIVKYAKERQITVIPEIEMPGHSVAALTAYPEISCTGGPFEVRTRWGISRDIYCAGNEKTFEFLEDVLSEVMELFPSKYIHIGGDEAPKDRWEKCPKCQRRMKEENLKDEHELQSYFIKRIEKFLNDNGRKLIGWDEILEGGLAPDATVMSWRGIQGGIDAAKQHHDVIMVPSSHLYFDGYQADPEIEPLAIGYWAPLEHVYSFNPIPEELTKEEAKHIIGGEATLWTEYIGNEDYAEYMVLPRMSALSEIFWTPQENKNWPDFQARLNKQYNRYYAMGANFRIPTPEIENLLILNIGDNITMTNPIDFGSIHYTLDGSNPTTSSPIFSKDLVALDNSVLKTAVFLPDGRHSSIISTTLLIKDKAPKDMEYGLNYQYFEGEFDNNYPNFSQLQVKTNGECYNFDIKSIQERWDQFAVLFNGKMNIKDSGEWKFYLTCDDGAKIFIDGKEVVGSETYISSAVSGTIQLDKGLHDLKVEFYEWGGAENLNIQIVGPGFSRQNIQPWMLYK